MQQEDLRCRINGCHGMAAKVCVRCGKPACGYHLAYETAKHGLCRKCLHEIAEEWIGAMQDVSTWEDPPWKKEGIKQHA